MAFKCPDCDRTSQNPSDEFHQYCGACHKFFDEAFEPREKSCSRFPLPLPMGIIDTPENRLAFDLMIANVKDCPREFDEIFFRANIEDLFA